jgi:hypothetical protein
MADSTYRPAFTLRNDGTFVDEEAAWDLERYVGRPVDDLDEDARLLATRRRRSQGRQVL